MSSLLSTILISCRFEIVSSLSEMGDLYAGFPVDDLLDNLDDYADLLARQEGLIGDPD